MKKGKICMIVCSLLLIAALSGCTEKQASATPESAASSTDTAAPTPSATPTPTPAAESPSAESGQTLESILTDLSENYHSGTAGCSLTAAKYAGEILDWSATAESASDTARETVKQVYASLSADAAAEFGSQVNDVYAAAKQLCGDGGSDLLGSCGYQAKSFPWDQASMESVFTAMIGALPADSVG
jgi:hypothetical protein